MGIVTPSLGLNARAARLADKLAEEGPALGIRVSVLGNGLYFSQSQRGELVGGMGDPDEPEGVELGSTLRFMARFARGIANGVSRFLATNPFGPIYGRAAKSDPYSRAAQFSAAAWPNGARTVLIASAAPGISIPLLRCHR